MLYFSAQKHAPSAVSPTILQAKREEKPRRGRKSVQPWVISHHCLRQHHHPGALWPTLSAGNHTVCLSPLVPGFCPSPIGLWDSSRSGSCGLPEAASIPLYDTPQLFIHITVDGHLSSFLFLAIGITPLSSSKNNVFAPGSQASRTAVTNEFHQNALSLLLSPLSLPL